MRGPPSDRSPEDLLTFGVVNLDKPPGPSAHQVVDWVRTFTREALDDIDSGQSINRVAHAGTLDPKVTGSLPTMLGDAVRLARVFDDSTKEYVTVLELHGPAPADFAERVTEFEGPIYQRPPRKSAVSRRRRVRTIHEIDILEETSRRALLRISCEAGTYVRKLCHDIGLALGTGAHMGDLRRTATGQFRDTSLVSMETYVDALSFWVEDDDPSVLYDVVEPAECLLTDIPTVTIKPSAARQVATGAPVYAPGIIDVETKIEEGDFASGDAPLVACYTPDGAAVCLGWLVGDPTADSGCIIDLERVLV